MCFSSGELRGVRTGKLRVRAAEIAEEIYPWNDYNWRIRGQSALLFTPNNNWL